MPLPQIHRERNSCLQEVKALYLPVNLAGVKIDNPTVLAPLAGWTDGVYRKICKAFGAGLVFTEMVSADGLIRSHPESRELAEFTDEERPIGVQVFGAEAETLAEAVARISDLRPEFIDLNFGCPAPKVVKRGGGAALLRDLSLIERITRSVKGATDIPITAKMRSGWEETVVVEACRILEDCGITAVTVHPRTQKMQFKGQADWSLIAQVKQAVSIPVIGNGDVNTAHDAQRMLDETHCDLVMIGRAARGNPWIFRQVRDFLQKGEEPKSPSNLERIQVCISHIQEEAARYGARRALTFMRKHIAYYIKGMPQAGSMRLRLFSLSTVENVVETLVEYSSSLQHSIEPQEEFVI